MILTDISGTMSAIVQMIINGFTHIWTWLKSFEFAGTNVLQILITCTILGAFLPTLLTIPKNLFGIASEKGEKAGKNEPKFGVDAERKRK